MTLGNIPDYLRSHVNCIKLVALCKEVDFDHKKVYGKIVSDINKLEEEGIEFNGEFIKGSILYIAGNNLEAMRWKGLWETFLHRNIFADIVQ